MSCLIPTGQQMLLLVPVTQRQLGGDSSFVVAAPKLWTDFPPHIRQALSHTVSKFVWKHNFTSWQSTQLLLFTCLTCTAILCFHIFYLLGCLFLFIWCYCKAFWSALLLLLFFFLHFCKIEKKNTLLKRPWTSLYDFLAPQQLPCPM